MVLALQVLLVLTQDDERTKSSHLYRISRDANAAYSSTNISHLIGSSWSAAESMKLSAADDSVVRKGCGQASLSCICIALISMYDVTLDHMMSYDITWSLNAIDIYCVNGPADAPRVKRCRCVLGEASTPLLLLRASL